MDQNQITNNQTVDNDLQKAIDDITNTTNVDPVFSDPVAAPSSVPEGDTGELGEPVGPFPEPKIEMVAPAPEPIAPLDPINIPDLPPTPPEPATLPTPEPASAPIAPETPNTNSITQPLEGLTVHQVKEAALRDLIPLLDHLDIDATQKFNLYRDIFEDLRDYTIIEPAYKVAREITDETKRAEALLYLVEAIDKM